MKTVKYGIIGCGMMGQEHLRNIALLPKLRRQLFLSLTQGCVRRQLN